MFSVDGALFSAQYSIELVCFDQLQCFRSGDLLAASDRQQLLRKFKELSMLPGLPLLSCCETILKQFWFITVQQSWDELWQLRTNNDQLCQVNVHQCIKCSMLRIKIFQLMSIGRSTFRDQDFPMSVHQWRFSRYDSVDLGIGGDHFFSGKSPMWRKRIKSSVKNSLTGRKISQQTQIKSRGGNKMWKVKSFRKIYF